MNTTNGYADHSLTGIVRVLDSDIISGRGGLPKRHPGNATYRHIVSINKEIYAKCPKSKKVRISKNIVAAVREIGGRFLEREDGTISHSLEEKKDMVTGKLITWRDIGDRRAIEMTSRALREGQPKFLNRLTNEDVPAAALLSMKPDSSQCSQFSHVSDGYYPDTTMPDERCQVTQQVPSGEQWLHASGQTTDSWAADPMALPYLESVAVGDGAISTDDYEQLMMTLNSFNNGHATKRPSVKIMLEYPKRHPMSATSIMSGMSLRSFPSALSLDSAMNALELCAEFENVGELDSSDLGMFSWGTYPDVADATHMPRLSFLKNRNMTDALQHDDPGLIFTSTLDSIPGGVNSRTDASGLLSDKRKNAVNFEVDFIRRRSSRMSLCSALTDFTAMYRSESGRSRRSAGSVLSIQSADFKQFMEGLDDSLREW